MAKVVVVLGHPQCGTTMLTGILHILGVSMFDEDKPTYRTLEDKDFVSAFLEDDFADFVNRRNDKYPMWGFKYYGRRKQLSWMKKYLENPIYLAIFKNPVNVSRRRYGFTSRRRLRNILIEMKEFVNTTIRYNLPVYILSYADACIDPERFVKELIEIVDIAPSDEQIAKAVAYIQPNTTTTASKKYPEFSYG